MSEGLIRFSIKHFSSGEEVKLCRPTPTDDSIWGLLAPLIDTSYGKRLPVVKGTSLSEALHGDSQNLLNELGPEPIHQLMKTPKVLCSQLGNCITADKKVCFPNPKMPICYNPEVGNNLRWAVQQLMLNWQENRYVIIVEGEEYSLTRGNFVTRL